MKLSAATPRNKSVRLAGALGLAAVLLAAAPAAAHAVPARNGAYSPSCVAEGCNNLDPVTQSNCSTYGYAVSGHTVTQSEDNNEGVINLMYQQYCKANWAEADHLSAGVFIEVFNTEGEYILYQPNYNWGYTSMVNGVPSAGVCIIDQYDNYGYCSAQPGSYPKCVIRTLFGATFYDSSGVSFYPSSNCRP